MNSFNVFNNKAIASTVSSAIDAQTLYAASFIATFSVTDAAGTMKIQASNEPAVGGNISGFVPSEASWIDVPSATAAIAAGAAANIPMPQFFCYRWLRVSWVRSAGTGTFTVSASVVGR